VGRVLPGDLPAWAANATQAGISKVSGWAATGILRRDECDRCQW
jgi:hypothetical protein